MEEYPFSTRHNGYLLFVGRISQEKGVHFAIEAANTLHMPLIIAAKLDAVDVPYFKGTVSGNGRIVNNKLVLDNAVVGVIPLSQANREYIAQEINNALISAAGKYNLSIKSLTLSNDKLTVVLEKIS
jgi:hypothetical protein